MEDKSSEIEKPKSLEPAQPQLMPDSLFPAGTPPEFKKKITQAMEFGISMTKGPSNPLFEKMNTDHVTQLLGIIGADNEREYKDAASNRKYWFLVFIIVVLLFVFCAVFFVFMKETTLLTQILTLAVGIGGGFGGGYGFCKVRQKGR